jgi:ribosomal protein S9
MEPTTFRLVAQCLKQLLYRYQVAQKVFSHSTADKGGGIYGQHGASRHGVTRYCIALGHTPVGIHSVSHASIQSALFAVRVLVFLSPSVQR